MLQKLHFYTPFFDEALSIEDEKESKYYVEEERDDKDGNEKNLNLDNKTNLKTFLMFVFCRSEYLMFNDHLINNIT